MAPAAVRDTSHGRPNRRCGQTSMLLVGYCYGIWFERRLCEEVELHLAYRWFCRLDLDDKLPARAGDGRQGRAGDVAGDLSGGAPHAAAPPRGHPAVHRQPPAALVSRCRSSQAFAAHSYANFGIKGTLASIMLLVPFEPEVRNRTRGAVMRTSGSGH